MYLNYGAVWLNEEQLVAKLKSGINACGMSNNR